MGSVASREEARVGQISKILTFFWFMSLLIKDQAFTRNILKDGHIITFNIKEPKINI